MNMKFGIANVVTSCSFVSITMSNPISQCHLPLEQTSVVMVKKLEKTGVPCTLQLAEIAEMLPQ